RRDTHFRLAGVLAGLALCAVLGFTASPALATVSVGMAPASQSVTPGTDFDLFIDVTTPGSQFNGFDAIVSFDPAALTFVPVVPSTNQQGCLMTGGCSGACGSTFHLFSAAGDSVSVSDVLLCNQVFLTRPRHLYKLRFPAPNTPPIPPVNIRSSNFYNAGLFVTPVQSSNATIGIGITLGVGPGAAPGAPRVRVEPNPSFGRVQFVSESAGDLGAVEILDLQGRVVRSLAP